MEPKPTYEIVAASREVSEAQRTLLMQKTPPDAIKQRKGPSGKMLSYVEHSWVTSQLNLAFNWGWSWEVRDWRLIPEHDPQEIFVLGRLTVHTPHGDLVKMQFGSAEVKRRKKDKKPLSVGDDLKAASSDALKKCASLLGLALDVYGGKNGKPNAVLTDADEVRAWLSAKAEILAPNVASTNYIKACEALATALTKLNLDPKAVMMAAWGEGEYTTSQVIAIQCLLKRRNAQAEIQYLLS